MTARQMSCACGRTYPFDEEVAVQIVDCSCGLRIRWDGTLKVYSVDARTEMDREELARAPDWVEHAPYDLCLAGLGQASYVLERMPTVDEHLAAIQTIADRAKTAVLNGKADVLREEFAKKLPG